MEKDKLFKKYQSRMTAEGLIKAVCCGLIVGFAVNFVTALICWLCGFKGGLWLSIGLGVAAVAGATAAFYLLKFRPTEKAIAERVDGLGFEERMITMLELSEDNSYIAMRQREDAQLHLANSNAKLLKLQVSKALVAVVAAVAVCGVGMTTVNALALGGVVPTVPELVNPEYPDYIAVSYIADEGGVIEGETDWILELGDDPEPVMAIADDGWIFSGWDDGLAEPYRHDVGITESYTFVAKFDKLSDSEDDDGDISGDPTDGGSGDDATDKPIVSGGSEGDDGNSEESGGGDDGNGTNTSNTPSNTDPGGNGTSTGPGAGGRYESNNQVIDGNTYYESVLGEYYQTVMELLTSEKELTPEEKAFIEKYFASL